MRQLLSSLIIICFFTSCVTQHACERKYPTQVKDSIVYKDTTILVHDTIRIPYEDVSFDTSSIGLPENIVFHHSVKKGNLTATVDINKGKLLVDCKADSLQLIVDSLYKITVKSEFKSEKSKPMEIEVYPWDYIPLRWYFVISIVLFLLWLGYKHIAGWVRSLF